MRPMFPSWIRSRKDIPRPMYFLAMETTRRRLASVRRCLASSEPASMALARSTSSAAVRRLTRPISFRYIRTGSSRETESIISISICWSSSASSLSSKSPAVSETSMPISLKAPKIRNICSGSVVSRSGNPSRTSSGVRKPCSLPLTIRTSACWISRSSSRGSTLSLVLAKLCLQPQSSRPAGQLSPLHLESSYLFVVAQALGLGKTRNYPSFASSHGGTRNSADHVVHHVVLDSRRRRRPGLPDQGLQFRRIVPNVPAQSLESSSLQGLHHLQVRDPVIPLQIGEVERGPDALQRLRPHRQHLEQITDDPGHFLPDSFSA